MRRRRSRLLLFLFLSGLLVACNPPDEFLCAASAQCGMGGTCQDDHHCSFLDPACPAGSRYGDHAGSLSGVCVGARGDGGTPDAFVPPGDARVTACENDEPAEAIRLTLPPERVPLAVDVELDCATDDVSPQCGSGGGQDVFFELDHTGDEILWINARSASPIPAFVVLVPGACTSPAGLPVCSERPCGDEQDGTLATRVGDGTYCLIVEAGFGTGGGQVGLTIMRTGVAAERLDELDGVRGSTCFGGNDVTADCATPTAPDLAYYLVPCRLREYLFELCATEASPWVPVLHTRLASQATSDRCVPGSDVACLGDGVLLKPESGEPYFLFVDGMMVASMSCGAFTLSVY